MALRKPLFFNISGYNEEFATADTVNFSGMALSGALDMLSNKVTSLGIATTTGDALAYNQSGAKLSSLYLTDLHVSGNTNLGDATGDAIAVNGTLSTVLRMGSNKITGLAAATAVGEGLAFGQSGAFLNGLTVSGDLVVNGSTTTVNSTTIDVQDRVIHVNAGSGSNDPVPSAIAGIAIDRGAITSTSRDMAALLWDEAAQVWKFAWNTLGDDSTVGALLALSSSNHNINGALVQSGSIFSLAGNAASSVRTDSGALTLSSAASAIWKTTTGSLTLDGTAGLNLQTSAATRIAIANSTATVQAGVLFGTTGTGNINLPNNASARFQIEGSAVSATVTGANLDILTNGSNADSLHTHAGATATSTPKVENTIAVDESISAGDPVYFTSTANRIGKGRADALAKSTTIGVARTAQASVGQTLAVVSAGPCAGILSSATTGTPYYLADGGGYSTSLPSAGNRIIQLGFAMNTTDLFVRIVDMGKRAA